MLDHLTNGRLEIGVVSGIPPELAVVGITPEVAAARHTEVIDVLDAALKHNGDLTSRHAVELRRISRSCRGACSSRRLRCGRRSAPRASAERAGRRGWKACGGFLSAKEIAVVFDAYRQGAEEARAPVRPRTDRRAPHGHLRRHPVAAARGRATAPSGRCSMFCTASAGPLPPWAALLDRPDESIATLSDEEFVSGTPQQVAEQLIEQCQVIGAGHLLVAFSERDHARLEESPRTIQRRGCPVAASSRRRLTTDENDEPCHDWPARLR